MNWKKVIVVKRVQLKEKLDKYRYGDMTTPVLFMSCIVQLGKYTMI